MESTQFIKQSSVLFNSFGFFLFNRQLKLFRLLHKSDPEVKQAHCRFEKKFKSDTVKMSHMIDTDKNEVFLTVILYNNTIHLFQFSFDVSRQFLLGCKFLLVSGLETEGD